MVGPEEEQIKMHDVKYTEDLTDNYVNSVNHNIRVERKGKVSMNYCPKYCSC